MKTEYLLESEVERVLSALTPSNRLACRVMLHTGLRISDVLAFRTVQLKPRFWITESKTGKRKQIGLPRELLEELRAQAGPIWVFEGRLDPGKHKTRQAVWADIKRAQRLFRMPRNAGSHSMRKIYAVELMERYGDIERVRRALNHDRAATTMIYAMADKLLRERGGRRDRSRLRR